MEAKNLEAKDANGFSDPYCMLGIIPGNREIIFEEESVSGMPTHHNNLSKMMTAPNFLNRNQAVLQQQPPQQSIAQLHSSGHKSSSLIKRFSSFRKSDKTNEKEKEKQSMTLLNKERITKIGVIRGKLPAKLIKTTDVKRETLNPVWKEKFKL